MQHDLQLISNGALNQVELGLNINIAEITRNMLIIILKVKKVPILKIQ